MTDAELLKVSESSGKASGAANGFNQLSQNEIMNPFSATQPLPFSQNFILDSQQQLSSNAAAVAGASSQDDYGDGPSENAQADNRYPHQIVLA